jgi:hypothetical protein
MLPVAYTFPDTYMAPVVSEFDANAFPGTLSVVNPKVSAPVMKALKADTLPAAKTLVVITLFDTKTLPVVALTILDAYTFPVAYTLPAAYTLDAVMVFDTKTFPVNESVVLPGNPTTVIASLNTFVTQTFVVWIAFPL